MDGDRAVNWKTGLKHRNHHQLWGKHAESRKNNVANSPNEAGELDSSAGIWLCTPQQSLTEALAFSAENQQLSDAMPMGKQQMPPLKQLIFFTLFGRQQTQSKQPMASTTMITSLKADETGASVAPGKKHHSGVRVDDKFGGAPERKEEEGK